MGYLFQNLRVYQQAMDFAQRVSSLTSGFARPNWYLADQFNRASLSIPLNIAESTGRLTPADKRRFLVMARGSAHECVALLEMCERKDLMDADSRSELSAQLLAIGKMLAGMMAWVREIDSVKEDAELYETE